ncbi:MAG: glycine/D-amino acid oxidase-like deaminating enzyme [Neolewinella sp.]|jgi:glycine/D-amino acid oxidase-like deaminating enzyme
MHFLLIGQGLAGTLLGYRLEKAGHLVHYIDAPAQSSATSVAAGIVNPITGRRFVKSWRIDELIPEAKTLYAELEAMLGVKLWYDMPLIRTLYNRGDMNDWEARSADPGYPEYMDDNPDPGRLPEVTDKVFAYVGVRHTARVDVGLLAEKYRDWLKKEGRFFEGAFDYSGIKELLGLSTGLRGAANAGAKKELSIAGLADRYDHVVCCEGWRARFNPLFNYLPHGGNKGEVLIVRTKVPILTRMFKHRVFLIPFGDDVYWVGATSENRFTEEGPTASNRSFLEDRLREVLTVPFEVVEHRTAVRPTVKDRRMFLGAHPEVAGLSIMNGLGTKGASLGPLGSRWMTEFLLEGKALPTEVDISRFG